MVRPLDLSGLDEQKQEFDVGGTKYIVHEPSENAVKQLRQRQLRNSKIVDGKQVRERPEETADIGAFFVSLCVKSAADDKAVQQSTIMEWPSKLVSRLSLWLLQFVQDVDDTEESIQKRIDELQKRLEKKRSGADDPKE